MSKLFFKTAMVLPVIAVSVMASCTCAAENRSQEPHEMVTLISEQGQIPVIVHTNEEGDQQDKRWGRILVKDAASDLQRYLKLVTGKQLPFGEERSDITCIHIGQTRYVKAMRLGLEYLDYDGFIICTRYRGNTPQLIIAGRTPVGTYNGVNYFLREYVGVQWLFPGELGEIVPKKASISIPAELDDKQEPDYIQRDFGIFRKPKIWEKYKLRSLMISPFARVVVGHGMGRVIRPDMYLEHPEYFPLINGKRFKPRHAAVGWQPCLSNPEIAKLFIKAAKDYFDASPEHLCFSLAENDSGGYCECDNCRAMDNPKAKKWATDLCPNYADRSWKFYVQVANEIEKSHPGRYLGVYSYLWSNEPPSYPGFKMPGNMVVRKTFPHESDIDRFERWSKLGVSFGGHDYIDDYRFFAFRHFPHQLSHEIRFRYRRGMRSSGFESYSRPSKCAPKLWILTRLLWDINENVDDLMKEYCRHAYGAATQPMLEFWNKWEDIYNRQPDMLKRCFFALKDSQEDFQFMTQADLNYLSERIRRATEIAETADDKTRVKMVADEYDLSRSEIQIVLDIRQAYDKLKPNASCDYLQSQMIRLANAMKYMEDVWPEGRAPEVGNFGTPCHVNKYKAWVEIPNNVERCQDDIAQAITKRLTSSNSPKQIMAYWTEISKKNPLLTRYGNSQIYRLKHPKRENLIKDPLFTTNNGKLRNWSIPKKESVYAFEMKPSSIETDVVEKGAKGIIGFKGFLTSDTVYQDIPIEPGKRYRAGISLINRVHNDKRMGWPDVAVARLKITCGKKITQIQTELRSDDWQDLYVTLTAPEDCQTARFEIYVKYYLDGEEACFTRPIFECISE